MTIWRRCMAGSVVVFAASVMVGAQQPQQPDPQQPTFSSRLDAVRVDVLVTDNGRPMQGLTPDDFVVLDNGAPQKVDLAVYETLPVNMVLALDHSKSVTGERLTQLQDAAKAVLQGLAARDQAALVTFSHRVALQQPLTHDAKAVAAAIDAAKPGGQTSLFDGVYAGLLAGVNDPSRNLVLVFSDGIDTASWLTSAQILETAKRSDAVVYALSPKDAGSMAFLRDLTEQTGGSAFEVNSLKELSTRFVSILEEFRHRYLLSYTPSKAAPGWHRLEVRLKNRRATVKARPGYVGR